MDKDTKEVVEGALEQLRKLQAKLEKVEMARDDQMAIFPNIGMLKLGLNRLLKRAGGKQ